MPSGARRRRQRPTPRKSCGRRILLSVLEGMGFSAVRGAAALVACNHNIEAALDWLLTHPEDMQAVAEVMVATGGGSGGAAESKGEEGSQGYEESKGDDGSSPSADVATTLPSPVMTSDGRFHRSPRPHIASRWVLDPLSALWNRFLF